MTIIALKDTATSLFAEILACGNDLTLAQEDLFWSRADAMSATEYKAFETSVIEATASGTLPTIY